MTIIDYIFRFLLVVVVSCLSGCLRPEPIVLREPATRMMIVGDGKLVLDSTTSRELDAWLERHGKLYLRGVIEEAPGDSKPPWYDSELMNDVICILVEAGVEVVLILPGPTDKDRATAELAEMMLEASGISVGTAHETSNPGGH